MCDLLAVFPTSFLHDTADKGNNILGRLAVSAVKLIDIYRPVIKADNF